MTIKKKAYVYLLVCSDQTLYCGWTYDIDQRLDKHNAGSASKYTRARLPVKLIYQETLPSKELAMKREYEIKNLSRQQKLALIDT